MKRLGVHQIKDINKKIAEDIALEYIVKETPKEEICRKFNISLKCFLEIARRMNLDEKKLEYNKRVLENSLNRCADYQSRIIVNSTEILAGHIESVMKKQRKLKRGAHLSSNEVRDVMAILAIVSKENRLDNDKPTEIVDGVSVALPEGFFPIVMKKAERIAEAANEIIVEEQSSIVEAEFKQTEEPKKIESKEEEIEVETSIIGNPLG